MNKFVENQKYLTLNEIKGIDEFVSKLAAQFKENLLIIKIIGSKIKGDFGPNSDIDLFILLKECNYYSMNKIAGISTDVNIKYDIIISPIVYSMEEHSKNVYFNNLFVRDLDRFGVLIYEAA